MNRTHQGSAPRVAGLDSYTKLGHSFAEIYDAYYDMVARWIRYLGGSSADHEDLVQEVFVIVHRRLADFDGRNLPGWLYRIAANQVRDYQRLTWIKHVFRRKSTLSAAIPSLEPTPAAALEIRERQRELEYLLSTLSTTLRIAFVLFEIEGYTAEEIAKMQSVPTNTVRARIHRARKKMTTLMESARSLSTRSPSTRSPSTRSPSTRSPSRRWLRRGAPQGALATLSITTP